MLTFQCWFCEQGIERSDLHAVVVSVENLWRWADGVATENDPLQQVYAHSECAKAKIAGPTMSLEPSILGEED